MPTLNLQVSASADDGHAGSIANDSGRSVTSSGVGSITATILSPGSHGSNDEYTAGARFLNVTVPNAATITSATFTLTAQATYNAGANTVSFLVSGQADDNAPTFTAATDQYSTGTRPRTTAVSAAWDQTSVTIDVEYTIDVTSVVQELVNRAGWVSGNAMVFPVDTNTTTTQGEWQDYYSYDGSTTKAPKLDITYTSGGVSAVAVRDRSVLRGVMRGVPA